MGALNMFLRKLFAVLCIVFFVVAVFSAASRFVVAGPPSSGDWIVTGTESYSNQTIVLNGNLFIEGGGNLTFRQVTLKMNCTYDGQYNIEVRSGGKFYVLDGSLITSVDPEKEYLFGVENGSTFRMMDSELHECGVEDGASGLLIGSNDVVIENNWISNNWYGIVCESSNPVIRNNNISSNRFQAVLLGHSNATIEANYMKNNGGGGIFASYYSIPMIKDNLITLNNGNGIHILDRCTPTIQGNNITLNGAGILLDHSSPIIFNNTITSNLGTGIHCSYHSDPTIQNNTITANGNGIHCENSNPTIQNNNISQNNNAGISVMGLCSPIISNNVITSNGWAGINPNNGSNPKIESNIIMKNGVGIFCIPNASGTISGNTITENIDGGISCHGSSNPTIQGNDITANKGIGIGCDNSSPTIQRNNITGHFPAPDCGWGAAILCYDNSAGTIEGNSITDNFNGITCFGYSNPIIEGNSIRNNDNVGVTCLDNSNPTIENNEISNNREGIGLGHSNPLIQGNTIRENNHTGISIKESSNATVQRNTIRENKMGIEISDNSTPTIQGNEIAANTEIGVKFLNWGNGLLEGNLIAKNSEGILLQHYCNPQIQGNIIAFNEGDGIRCEDESKPLVHKNDIYSNTGFGITNTHPGAVVNATSNYWGSSTGPVQTLLPDGVDPEEISGNILYNPWLTEPIIIAEITNPLSNETVSATVTVSANVRAINGVQRVEFYIDELKYTDFDSPYEWSWDTTQYAETPHTIWVAVHDIYGLTTKVSRTVFVDNTPPTALFKEPQSGITYYGIVTIGVNATDNREMGNVRIRVGTGAWLIMTYNPTNSLWEYNLNTTSLSDGQHSLSVLALDRAGNPATTSITILTDNTPPSLTIQHPQSGITVGLTLTVMVQANDLLGVSKVEFYLGNTLVSTLTTLPYQWAWDTTKYPNGAYTITVEAYDTIGNIKTRDITVTVNNVEVPWLQANLLTIVQVAIGLGGLLFAVVTYWSRTKNKRKKKKTTKKKETTNVPPKETSDKEN